jgi:hypothetical protein
MARRYFWKEVAAAAPAGDGVRVRWPRSKIPASIAMK